MIRTIKGIRYKLVSEEIENTCKGCSFFNNDFNEDDACLLNEFHKEGHIDEETSMKCGDSDEVDYIWKKAPKLYKPKELKL